MDLEDASLEPGGRMFRLMRAWNIQAQKIDAWSRRMLDICEKNKSPSMVRKLTKMMDQIMIFKKKEQKIIEEIEEIEKKHHYMKQKNLLRQVPLKPRKVEQKNSLDEEDDEEILEARKTNRLLITLAWVWMIMRSQKRTPRQDIRPN